MAVAFVGGRILPMDPAVTSPEAVVVTGAHVVDLTGRTLLPGFIDAHNHLSLAALYPRWADLSHSRDVATLQSVLRTHVRDEPDAAWVRGSNWELSTQLPLTRHDLDALGLDRPVVVAHFSFHQCVVSSLGLERLGVTRATPDPPGGEIDRDGAGDATGVLRERAWSRAHAASLAGSVEPQQWDDLIVARMRTLLSNGITTVHDAACAPAAEAAYGRLRDADRMALSVLAMPHPAEVFTGPDPARLAGPPTGEGDAWLRVGPVKLFADGGSHPRIDAHAGGRRIAEGYEFPDLGHDARRAADRGFALATHAMGNVGLQRTLDAYRDVRRRRPDDDVRLRVEHATLAGPTQIDALARLGALAVVQPGFVETVGRRVGHMRFDDVAWMPFADLADAGVTLAASSDHPSGPASPLAASRSATEGGAPQDLSAGSHQPLPLHDWLRAWTVGAAIAGGQEHDRGSITPGKRADLVVLDGDPADSDTGVAQTWVAGRKGHDRDHADVTMTAT
jgi:predicted amidohydrolase YtcJ